jgi:hypothetical protein
MVETEIVCGYHFFVFAAEAIFPITGALKKYTERP